MKILLLVILACFQCADGDCTFPSDISSSVWTSTEFGDITFGTTVAEFSEDGGTTSSNWTCHVSSGSKYVLQSLDTGLSASLGTNVYFYYCFDFYSQGTDSYLYYHPTAKLGVTEVRKLHLGSATTTVTEACSESIDAAEYNVMVKKASASSVKNYCVSPLLADFLYTCSSGSTDNGTINTCDTSTQETLVFNHTQCPATEVIYSTSGVLNCVAKTSGTVSSETIYYQTLYNTDATVNGLTTHQFVCLAVTEASNGTVFFSYQASVCSAGQTSTVASGTVLTFEPLTSTTLCPTTTTTTTMATTTIINSSSNNTVLIVALVVGILVLLLIVGILIFCFCFYKKDPNAGKPIVENTKPRFEDPDNDILEDLELVDTSSTPVTRDEVIFEAMSPNIISNGKWPNGNALSMSPTGFIPSGMTNGSARRDSGIDMAERSNDRPIPRIGLNPTKESMVIFNGDEKVISGNDTRIVPNENPNARTFQMNNSTALGIQLTLHGLDNEEDDALGELSPHNRDNLPYISLPRQKSNLFPPMETTDPGQEKEEK